MNREIQLHDGEISAFNQTGDSIAIVFSTVEIHESNGVPGYDPGKLWPQAAVITIEGIAPVPTSMEFPIWAIHGTLRMGQIVHEGFIPSSIHYRGDTALDIVLSTYDGSDGGTLSLSGTGVRIELLGEPSDVGDFNECPRRSIG